MSFLQSCDSVSYFNKKPNEDEGIDYEFYDSNLSSNGNDSDFEEIREGIKKIHIKPSEKFSRVKSQESEKYLPENLENNLTKCIAYETSRFDNHIECSESNSRTTCSRNSAEEEDTETLTSSPIISTSPSTCTPTSDLTNVTPFSSSSSCSSAKEKNENNYSDEEESPKLEMKLLSDAVESLSLNKKNIRSPTHSIRSKMSVRPRRKNMTFTNEQLRKIDRENEILLKKIMSHTKPRPKPITFISNSPHLKIKASAAVNRLKQQRQINHDNYILLKKIHHVKSTQSLLNRN